MFTGIIKILGRVHEVSAAAGGRRMVVVPDPPLEGLQVGESVAVEGTCLTAEPGSTPDRVTFFLSDETLKKTTLAEIAVGTEVNLERSLTAGDMLGGHLVMGHVDAVGTIRRLDRAGEAWDLEVAHPESLRPYLAPKGSISVSGISLTIVESNIETFTVAIIPHTREATSLRTKSAGSPVNLEVDTIARYVVQFLTQTGGSGGVSAELLKQAGFS